MGCLDYSIKSIPLVPLESSLENIRRCIDTINLYAKETADMYKPDIVGQYANSAKKLARNGKDPSEHIVAAEEFLVDCPPEIKEEYTAKLSLVMPVFYAARGNVESCINEVIKVTSNPESGVPRETTDEIYNLANMNRALNEAEF